MPGAIVPAAGSSSGRVPLNLHQHIPPLQPEQAALVVEELGGGWAHSVVLRPVCVSGAAQYLRSLAQVLLALHSNLSCHYCGPQRAETVPMIQKGQPQPLPVPGEF